MGPFPRDPLSHRPRRIGERAVQSHQDRRILLPRQRPETRPPRELAHHQPMERAKEEIRHRAPEGAIALGVDRDPAADVRDECGRIGSRQCEGLGPPHRVRTITTGGARRGSGNTAARAAEMPRIPSETRAKARKMSSKARAASRRSGRGTAARRRTSR